MWLYLFIANVHYLLSMISMKLASMIWLEANTERSESNPGRSLGLYKARRDRLSGRQYPTDMLLHLRLSAHAFKMFTDNADATDFIFSRILFLLVLLLGIRFTTDCFCAYTALDSLQQEIIRENPSAQQAPNILQYTIKIRERTDPSHQRYP